MNNRELAKSITNSIILDELSKDGDWYVLYRVADNPNTTPETLDSLSKDKDWRVRYRVANNPNTTPETLDYLSKDKDSDVRCGIAKNPNTTPETLDYLSKDEYWNIRCDVALNSNTTPETLKEMFKVETDSDVKKLIEKNPNYPNVFERIKMFFNKVNNTPESNDNWIEDFENSIINSLSDKEKYVYEIYK
jgi:hypothetical protein